MSFSRTKLRYLGDRFDERRRYAYDKTVVTMSFEKNDRLIALAPQHNEMLEYDEIEGILVALGMDISKPIKTWIGSDEKQTTGIYYRQQIEC